ncbi:50S ribosomal protein L6 [Xylocopilactobacillus apicola]|uniref:Large ribosomal subunit protein uL6 n=1 Tax=Xylocopilactobacillus apicola TaxID=2932184 RepID=A0AAU9DAU3_9LACO|nr:50S ribosomal protein L6 [Xylocopilactobacillus apicola]BDR59525.1 50S ribosomal protein L6 [Xylocopilactobacillus apicola]
MSRIGYKKVVMPEGVTMTQDGNTITVKGPKGSITRTFRPEITVKVEGNVVSFDRKSDEFKPLHGTTRALFANMVEGVHTGFKKQLNLVGVGYRAQMQGQKLVLNVGYSHPVEMPAPEGIKIEVPSNTEIIISGISKESVGKFAAEIREVRPPEPYKGKGIRYLDEQVRRKEGKTGK